MYIITCFASGLLSTRTLSSTSCSFWAIVALLGPPDGMIRRRFEGGDTRADLGTGGSGRGGALVPAPASMGFGACFFAASCLAVPALPDGTVYRRSVTVAAFSGSGVVSDTDTSDASRADLGLLDANFTPGDVGAGRADSGRSGFAFRDSTNCGARSEKGLAASGACPDVRGFGVGFGGTWWAGALGGEGLGLSGLAGGRIGCGRGAPPCERVCVGGESGHTEIRAGSRGGWGVRRAGGRRAGRGGWRGGAGWARGDAGGDAAAGKGAGLCFGTGQVRR